MATNAARQASLAPDEHEPTDLERPALNRSLERGLSILRCFRPGLGALGNADLVARTGLPKATVSRLTQTLVRSGFLRKEASTQAFRLSYSVLSLSHAVMLDSQVAHEALPLMQQAGDGRPINLGLSVPDDLDMVYLHVVHGDRSRLSRRIEPGHRRPMETNAVGRAYLATLSEHQRKALLARCKARHRSRWTAIAAEIDAARAQVESAGYCSVIWGHGTESIAVPVVLEEGVFVMNVSYNVTTYGHAEAVEQLVPMLLQLGRDLRARVVSREAQRPA